MLDFWVGSLFVLFILFVIMYNGLLNLIIFDEFFLLVWELYVLMVWLLLFVFFCKFKLIFKIFVLWGLLCKDLVLNNVILFFIGIYFLILFLFLFIFLYDKRFVLVWIEFIMIVLFDEEIWLLLLICGCFILFFGFLVFVVFFLWVIVL